MKHNFEENKERRLNAAKDRIESNEAAADEHFQAADKIASYIPMGQPILVGHHSERRHRKDLERINGSMSKGRSALEKAEYYRDRVKAMESNTAISSDDPNAIQKLTGKLDKLIEIQGFMKNANKCIRKKDKDGFLLLAFGTEPLWETLTCPEGHNRIGFPQYKLTNNNANIRRIRVRLKELTKIAGQVTTENTTKGVRVVQNVEANRVQLIFPSKPSEEVITRLHQVHRFHWYVKEKAWQRFLNPQSIHEAKAFLNWYDPDK